MKVTRRGVEPAVQSVLEQIKQRAAVIAEKNMFGPDSNESGSTAVAGVPRSGASKPKNPAQAAKQTAGAVQAQIDASAAQRAKKMGNPDPATAAAQSHEPPQSPQERAREASFKKDILDKDKDKDGELDPGELTSSKKKKTPGSMTEEELDTFFFGNGRLICVNEDYEDQYGRCFTEDEIKTHFKMKSPEYDITFEDWKEKHFRYITEDQTTEEALKLIKESEENARRFKTMTELYEWQNQNPDTHHHIRSVCEACGNVTTCRCRSPKETVYVEACRDCEDKLVEAESIKQRKMREPEPFEDPTKDEIKKKKAMISANPKGAGAVSTSEGRGIFSESDRSDTLDRVFG